MVFLYRIKCVCFYISVSIIYTLEKKRKFSVLWKKYRIFMRGQLRRIPSWSIFRTIKEDITWVLLDLSLRDKVCLFFNILLYHIYIRKEENTFLFYKKMLYLFAGPTRKNPVLVNFSDNTRSNVYNLLFTWSFSTGTLFVSTNPSLSYQYYWKR